MFTEDENDIFLGSPKSKFFDILFNANRNLVCDKLDLIIEKYVILEYMMENDIKPNIPLDIFIDNFAMENSSLIKSLKNDMFIDASGDILSQNE